MQVPRLANRREFIRFSVIGVAGTAILAACAPAAPPTPTPAPKPTEAPKPAATTAPAAAPTTAPAPAAPTATTAPAAKPTEAPKPTEAAKPTVAAAPTVKPSGPVTISVATSWTGEGEKKLWEQLIAAYQKKFPNVTVKLDLSSSGDTYDQKLFAQLAAGTLPDIIYTTDNYVVPFKQNKVTRDMIPFAKATNFPYQDFDKAFLDLGMVEGELHMLPRGGDVVVLFINKKIAQESGAKIPWKVDWTSKEWTKDDFALACRRMTVDTKGRHADESGFDKQNVSVYGAAISNTWWAVYVPAVISEGGQLVSADLSKSLLDSPEAVKAFDWLTHGIIDGYWASSSFLNTVNGASAAWTGGKVATIMTVRAGIPSIRDAMKDDWDVCHFPMGSAKRVTGMGTLGFAISGSTKVPEVAWSFLDWMYGEEGMTILASGYGSVPAQKRFYKSGFWRDLKPPPANNDVFVDAFSYGTLPPRLPFYTTGPFTKALNDGLLAIELGKSTPKDVVKSVHDELNRWLQQSQKK